MRDGVRLAVSYWMPKARKGEEKFPVFFEMNGRKDDLSYLSWDYPVGAYFARHGYYEAVTDYTVRPGGRGASPPCKIPDDLG